MVKYVGAGRWWFGDGKRLEKLIKKTEAEMWMLRTWCQVIADTVTMYRGNIFKSNTLAE
jgi:hypothetical protein